MNIVAENIERVKQTLPSGVRLVAVSKFHPVEMIREAYDAGQRLFGESKVQELLSKKPVLPEDIEWHFIGHLQTNKVKQIVPFVSMIHSADSPKLLQESKFGFSFEECRDYLRSGAWKDLRHVRFCGVMGMATFTNDCKQIESEFLSLRSFFDEIKKDYFPEDSSFCEISMGMSDDYLLAVKAGSTLVRVGSRIFGERVY